MSRARSPAPGADQVFAHVVEGIRAVIGCEDAIIYSYDEGADALQMVTGLGRVWIASAACASCGRSIAGGSPTTAVHASSRQGQAPGNGAEVFLGGDKLSPMCAPLISKDRLQGVIMFAGGSFQPRTSTPSSTRAASSPPR